MPDVETSPQLERLVLALVREEILQVPPDFGVASDLFDAGLDSMAIMQLLLLLEERFGVAIPAGSVSRPNFKDAQSISALLQHQGYRTNGSAVHAAEEPAPVAAPPPVAPPASVHGLNGSAPAAAPALSRLALRDCDFFTHAFDQMLRSAGQGGHVAHSFVELDRAPDVAALQKLIGDLGNRFPFPLLTAQLRKPSFFSLPAWFPAANPRPLQLHLWSAAGSAGLLKPHGSQAFDDLQTKLDDIVNAHLPQDDDGWVNARFDLVEKGDGAFVFVFSWSHLIIDGVGAEQFLVEMNRLLGAKHEPVPAFDFSDAKDTRGWVERWRTAKVMPNIFADLMKTPFQALGSHALTKSRNRFQVITLTQEQTAEAARRSAAISGPLINMPFHLACAMRAHDRILRHRGKAAESLMCCVPIQVRKKGARGPLFQNHLTMFFCALSAAELTTLDSAAQALQEQHTRFIKEKLGDAFRDLMWLMRPMPPGLHMKFINWQMKGMFSSFYHSNTGVFAPELTEFAGATITNAYHVPGFSNPPGTGVFANEKNGRLVLTLCWRDGAMSAEERQIFIDHLMEDMGVTRG
ncbi:MAG: acyl carrier protein [Prosthecobacter sp.]|nr:acyl carrier protein [Prosthecobacter sp.]